MKRQPRRIGYVKSDRKAALALVLLAVVATVITAYIGWCNDRTAGPADSADSTIAQVQRDTANARHSGEKYYKVEGRKVELFPFDPNTADSTALLRLGLQPWQVRSIYKYRASGGVFSHPDDFARLYGLTTGQFRRLKPYIRISPDFRPAAETVGRKDRKNSDSGEPARQQSQQPQQCRPHSNKISGVQRIALNTADTTELMRVPGIGHYYARRIEQYRQRLGGYVSVEQLDEIDGFPSEAKHFFTIEQNSQKRINVNKLDLVQLRRHPYMGYRRAKAIVEYRRLHGRIKDLNELSASGSFSSDDISRLEPYVEF
jgi:DNA uptake protein ComE-like DNA-binding protein